MIKLSWNPVLNKFIEIKWAFLRVFSRDELYDYDRSKQTCLDYWVEKLDNPEYTELIKPLQLIEHNGLLLIRYGNYADVFGGEDDVTPDEFWDKYDGFYLECRSVVIDIKENRLVITPFKKFRNLNECEETSIENISKRIKDAKCVEFSDKLDGSMQAVRYYVNMHRVLSEISSVNLVIKNIADGTFDDMISKVPTAYKDRVLKTANVVFKYIHNTELEIKDYFDKAPKDDKKEFMLWVENNVPNRIKAYVREKYYGKEYNLIKSKSGRYTKLFEMETKDNE